METKTTITFGIIGVLLLSGLGAYYLTPEQLAVANTCTTNNVTGIFERLSATNVTAYWTVNGTSKQAVCTKGKWIPTTQWLIINNLTEKDITINPVEESVITEDNIEIVTIGKEIIVDKSKSISINGQIYNITYTEKATRIKCICEKTTGCNTLECLQ